MMKIIGIPRSLLYYYDGILWTNFFKYLNIDYVISDQTNKKILEDGINLAQDEACLSLKINLGHVNNLLNKTDTILVPRLYSIKKGEQVCTNFNALYDIVNNTFKDINIINYNVDLTSHDSELIGFLKLGEALGKSYINSYNVYKHAKRAQEVHREKLERAQEKKLNTKNIKLLLAGHPYTLYDSLISNELIKYLKSKNITCIYSDRIDHNLIDLECRKLSSDIHWTHSKEVVASINYYKDKVDGIILLSTFPCGPDSLSNELIKRKVLNVPILTLVFDSLFSDTGLLTRLESYLDILENKRSVYERNN